MMRNDVGKAARRPTATYEPIRPPRGAEPTWTAFIKWTVWRAGYFSVNQFLRSTFTDLAGLVPRELAVLYSVPWVCSGWALVSRRVYSCLVCDYSFRARSDLLGLDSYYSDPWDRKYRAAVCLAEFGPANSGC